MPFKWFGDGRMIACLNPSSKISSTTYVIFGMGKYIRIAAADFLSTNQAAYRLLATHVNNHHQLHKH